MTMAGQIILAVLALLIIVLGGSQLAGPHLGKYTITDNSIEYTMFGNFRVWKSSFDDISDIQIISFPRLWVTPSLRLMNRPFAQYVLIRKRRGIFRAVVITPDNPEEFVRLIQQRIRQNV
jgi:hypothetical protein